MAFVAFWFFFWSAYGGDQDDCDEKQRIFATTLVFLWLLITTLGLTYWTSLQLSEVVHSVDLDEVKRVESTPTAGGVTMVRGPQLPSGWSESVGGSHARTRCAVWDPRFSGSR